MGVKKTKICIRYEPLYISVFLRFFAEHVGKSFINVYKTLFDKHYARWLKELLQISIEGKPNNVSTFFQWYLCVTEPYKTDLNIGECDVHDCNVSTKIWRNHMDSLTINLKDFDGDPIIYHKSTT